MTPCACRRRRQRNSGLPNFPGGAFDLRHKQKRSDPAARLLEHDPQTSPVGPNHPTALFRDAKQQFKSIGHFGLRIYLEACPTGRIVNNVTINSGSFRANDYFGLGTLARWANASKVSRIHYRPLLLIRNSSDRLADYPENFVSVYGYRNTSCGDQARHIVQLRDVRSADLELWFGGEARARALLGSAVSSWPRHGRKLAGSATPEDAIDAGRLAENDRPGHCRGTARRQAQGSNETADEVAIGRGRRAEQAGDPAGPRRILLRTDDGAQPGLRWIDY